MSSTAFNYVTAEKAALYRAVMQAFAAAKAHFIVHLRPEEIIERLGAENDGSLDEISAALEQLVAWGNLLAQPDTGRVTTVEDFYRARHLYQLSRQGEAAEAALAVFDELLGRRGALQVVALRDIRDTLVAIEQLCHEEAPDAGRAHALLRDLSRVFEDLADNAQAFMAGLGRALDLRSIDRDAFLAYKEKVIDYLKRFVGDLAVLSPDIAQLIRNLDGPIEKLLILVATREAEDLGPRHGAKYNTRCNAREKSSATSTIATTLARPLAGVTGLVYRQPEPSIPGFGASIQCPTCDLATAGSGGSSQ